MGRHVPINTSLTVPVARGSIKTTYFLPVDYSLLQNTISQ